MAVERIGAYDEVKEKCGDMDPLQWAKQYAAKRTAEEKKTKQDVYYSLGLDNLCNEISAKYKFEYDLNDILSMLVYARIIAPGSKLSSLESALGFLEQPKCDLHQVYRTLEVIAKENDFFQAELYRNSQSVINRKKEILHYDCTNYYFEIEEENSFRKYGVSKDHRPNPVVQMGMFMDAGLSSATNRKFNSIQGRGFIITQSAITFLDQKQIDKEAKYDGLYAVCTNLEYDVPDIIKKSEEMGNRRMLPHNEDRV